MGAAESRQGGGIDQDHDDQEKKKGESSMGSGSGTALAVGAAVGTALLGVAWGVSRYRSNDSEVTDRDRDQVPISNYFQDFPGGRGPNFGTNFGGGSPPPFSLRPSPDPIPITTNTTLKILSYNVWSREDVEIQKRMKAIGELVQLHSPHFICFQEITPNIYKIFQRSSWWEDYYCSMTEEEASNKQYFCILLSTFRPVDVISAPLGNSKMGRELSVTETKVRSNKSLVVATSHLKSRCADPNVPNSQYHQFKRERLLQAKEALTILQKYPNVIFCGDMNWEEKKDGEFPLPNGWVDAWTELKGEEKGYTFDAKSNDMLNGNYRNFRMRFDRILCNLKGFRLDNIEIIGKDRIPYVSYQKNKKMLPVLPSDHYGLLLTICT